MDRKVYWSRLSSLSIFKGFIILGNVMLVTVAFMVTLGIFIVVSVAVQVSQSLIESYLMSHSGHIL